MKNITKKILISIITVAVVISVIGFAYPFFVRSHVAMVPVQASSQENFGQKIINDIKQVAGGQAAAVNYSIIADDTNATDTQQIALDKKDEQIATSTPAGTLPVYFGVIKDNLIDTNAFPDGDSIYSMIRTLASVPSASRAIATTSFTAANSGYYVYFAWPTSYENGGKFSCKSITLRGKAIGAVDCFQSGLSDSLLFNTTDLEHRELPQFTDSKGNSMSYELYRAHYFISPGTTVYYKTF